MDPKRKRAIAKWAVIASVVVGWPLSWWIPDLPDEWFERLVTFLSFFALTLTLIDWHSTSDVRTEQEGNK